MLDALAGAAASDDPLEVALGVIQTVLGIAGTIAFAISGAVSAGRKRLDLVGVLVLACLVAVGGGTMRDVLVGVPVFWVDEPGYLLVAGLTALGVVLLSRTHALDTLSRNSVIQISDAAGMALFVVTGTNVALAAGASSVSAAIIGVISGIGGGIIRDILANDVPDVLRNGQFYATAALIGALVYIGLLALEVDPMVVFWIPIALILTIRLLALRLGWGVPTFAYNAQPTAERAD